MSNVFWRNVSAFIGVLNFGAIAKVIRDDQWDILIFVVAGALTCLYTYTDFDNKVKEEGKSHGE